MNDTGKSSPSLSDATIKAIQAENANLRADLQAEKAAHEQTKQSWKADFDWQLYGKATPMQSARNTSRLSSASRS